MSEVISIIESFEKASKGSNIKFKASENTYDFDFISKPNFSRKGYISKVEKISKDWKYKENADIPTTFMFMGENVLSINIIPKLWEIVRCDTLTLSGFSISRNYEKSKELADYMLKIFRPK